MRRAVVGLALVACACGGGDTGPDVGALAASVTAQTAAKKSAHVTFELAGGTTGEGDYRAAPDLAADFRLTGISGQTRFVLLDKVIYLQQGGAWHRYTAGTPQLADSLLQQADLGRQLNRIGTAGTITETSAQTLDGVRTTRYAIDVDVAKLIETEPDQVLKASLRALDQHGVTRIPYQLWLDPRNLPVKITIALAGKVTTIHYSHWGEPVTVTAPPADQVTG